MWEFRFQMLADIAQIEGFQIPIARGMEEDENGHHLTVEETAGAVAMGLPGIGKTMFFISFEKYLQNSSR